MRKGSGLVDWHHRPDRLDVPRLRGDEASQDETLGDLADALGGLLASATTDAIALYLATGLAYDAAALGIGESDMVEIASTNGLLQSQVDVDPTLRSGVVTVGHGRVDESPGLLTSLSTDVDDVTTMPLTSGVPVTVRPTESIS